ncbi:acetyl-CoA synthetase-like protein [Laetiporus sulphureus 93-53]|uniref:Acetyl-CoA synthetase-like protein n=1 Tax=Laetiporus sulphureus 93-53 TaxID=1314785 RepID=A0A165BN30_9APHY|nr:acetyl-CoA synthetase-like protein [Laetiporus sulphureus 93-53]KZT01340.1 acetyl-CoA synthetase-like protein [Laetiporus sulphureus 93-53]
MHPRRSLPKPPQTQARTSTTFCPPPLDGSLTLPEIFDWHLDHTPDHRLFLFAKDDGSIRTIYWPEGVRAIYAGAKVIKDHVGANVQNDDVPIVAILAPSDAIPYFTMTMSIMRANCIAFPISPRNSPLAVAHLVSKTGVRHILVGREQATTDLANEAIQILKLQHPSVALPELSPMPLLEELFLPPEEQLSGDLVKYRYRGPDATAIILHSSGSTAFPKPVYWTNHRFLQLCLIPYFGERDLTDQVFSLHVMPMYHGMGILQLCWTASSGLVISSFEPKSPAPVPTPDALFTAAKATNSDIIFCVPSFIEAWSRNPEYVKWLSTRQGVLFGGGPLNKEAGDYLTSQGVSIFILYGSTEGGIMSCICPPEKVGYDWDYFRLPDLVTPEMQPYGDNTFEFVMVSNDFCRPSVLNTKVNGVDGYATSDLLAPHATKPGYWRIFGRTDDQIMHNTGEKTNPGPLENMLNQDPHVLASVMFGRGRFQAGVLVDPKPEYKFDPSDQSKLAEFRNMIWPTIERMNAYAPQHSRLFKEMILVSKPSKPFTYTAKNTARRQAVIDDYEEEINAAYDLVEESTQSSIPPPRRWDIVTTTKFVRAVVSKISVHHVQDSDDLFEHGCDSLQATWIRNSLLRALRESAQLDTRTITGNFVYDHPTINRLAAFILSLASGSSHNVGFKDTRATAMRAMAAEYSGQFPARPIDAKVPRPEGQVVLVTGTTGSLGCHLLSRLVSDSEVSRIYALNRAARDKTSLLDRHRNALRAQSLSANLLEYEKSFLLEGDLTEDNFGLPFEVYEEMHRSVTHIIHNAWRVDFNLALTSFQSNVKGVRALINFALTSPLAETPRIIYTSSIGVFQNFNEDALQLEEPIEAEAAVGSGYSESKWVSEHILYEAARKTPLSCLIVRVGQLCGSIDGAWNIHEWFPSLVESTTKLKCFPEDHRVVDWVPLDVAAQAMVEFTKASHDYIVVHLVHPHPVSWSSIANSLSRELSVSLVEYTEWLARLESLLDSSHSESLEEVEALRDMRALRLLPFFRGLARTRGGNALGFPELAVEKAKNLSPTLANGAPLTADDAVKWLTYWRGIGLLPTLRTGL